MKIKFVFVNFFDYICIVIEIEINKKLIKGIEKMKMTAEIKRELKQLLDGYELRFKRDNSVTAKRTYFYTHGWTVEKHEDNIKANLDEWLTNNNYAFRLIDSENVWREWPKDSFFSVTFDILNINKF